MIDSFVSRLNFVLREGETMFLRFVVVDYTIQLAGLVIVIAYFIIYASSLIFKSQKLKAEIPMKPAVALFCGRCGEQVAPQFNLCPFCGSKLTKSVKLMCPVCGMKNPAEYTFCLYCGARLSETSDISV